MFTGSLVNACTGTSKETPKVGDGATELCWSDRHGGTIIAVSKSGREVTFQHDKATRTDKNGMSEDQDWTFTPNPTGETQIYTLRKNGRWVTKGSSMHGGTHLSIGHRDEYYDFSF